jgi:alkylation response protein AidB-like acyl-CoA dehydrogenase
MVPDRFQFVKSIPVTTSGKNRLSGAASAHRWKGFGVTLIMTDEQTALYAEVRAFAANLCTELRHGAPRSREKLRGLWAACGEMEILGLPIPYRTAVGGWMLCRLQSRMTHLGMAARTPARFSR